MIYVSTAELVADERYILGCTGTHYQWYSWDPLMFGSFNVIHHDKIFFFYCGFISFIFFLSKMSNSRLCLDYDATKVEITQLSQCLSVLFPPRNPNVNHDGPVEYQKRWPQFTNSEQKHLGLNSESVKIHKGLRNQMCAFWNRFLPRLLNITGRSQILPVANWELSST